MEVTLLITQASFAPFVDITSHVNPKRLEPHIYNAQIMHVRPLLGEELYNELAMQQKELEVTPLNQLLIAALTPLLAYAAYLEYLPYSNITSTAFGTVVKRNDFSDPVDAVTLSILIKNVNNKVSFYSARLTEYLQKTSVSYPLYKHYGECRSRDTTGKNTIIAIR